MSQVEHCECPFRIYYDGGAVHEGLDSPGWGVLAIVQPHPTAGREVVAGEDFYVRVNGRWLGVDMAGLLDHLTLMGIVKVGRRVQTDAYRAVLARAIEDPGFPPKSARLPTERF